jgi:hypothetical protein
MAALTLSPSPFSQDLNVVRVLHFMFSMWLLNFGNPVWLLAITKITQ